ncbi:non-hydrolyzing UDP-N-acetylglucosamine 2-epimerase [Methylobacterium sp. A49B]
MEIMHRILTVVGARPQFIKAAPVSKALRASGIKEMLLHTGQHFDPMMSDVFFRELGLDEPAYNLDVHSLSHGAMTARMLEGIERVILDDRPGLVLVYGDTNSTLAGALAAAKLHVPVAHVEAGLRSFNRRMPEEINRVATDHMSRLLFCPTEAAMANLAREGVTLGVFATGDVMYDAALAAAQRAAGASTILETLGLAHGTYAVATVHRAENTDDEERFARVVARLAREAELRPLVLVAHPRTQQRLRQSNRDLGQIKIVEPLGYIDMAWLVRNAAGVLTDSGGLQKEAYFYRVPCVTLRDETEWVETIEAGWNRLWTTEHELPRREILEYGDGHSAEIIVNHISQFLTV